MSRFIVTEIQANERHQILPWLICGIGAIFYCYEYFLRIVPSVMTADLMRVYHLSAGQFGDLTAFYYYAYTPMQLIVGVLMDRYGPRHLLVVACLSCVVGAFLFANSHYVPLAELSRFLIGFGSAFAFVGALKLASIWLPPERFASVSGGITALGMLGAMSGDLVLTRLVDFRGWRSTVSISAWIGVALTIIILMIVHDRVKTTRKTAYVPELSFGDVFAGLWVSLKNRHIWINGMIGFFLFLPVSAFAELWGIPYLNQAHHLAHGQSAAVVSMIFLGWAIGGPLFGVLSDTIRRRKLPLIGGACASLIIVSIILYVPNISLFWLRILFLLFGFVTSVQVLVFAIGREISSKNIAGTAVALTNMFIMMGGALFQPLIGVLLDARWSGKMEHGLSIYSLQDYRFALCVLPLGIIISIILSCFLKETHCSLCGTLVE
jgi:MFS family permease